jgi:hypothetical protein
MCRFAYDMKIHHQFWSEEFNFAAIYELINMFAHHHRVSSTSGKVVEGRKALTAYHDYASEVWLFRVEWA